METHSRQQAGGCSLPMGDTSYVAALIPRRLRAGPLPGPSPTLPRNLQLRLLGTRLRQE